MNTFCLPVLTKTSPHSLRLTGMAELWHCDWTWRFYSLSNSITSPAPLSPRTVCYSITHSPFKHSLQYFTLLLDLLVKGECTWPSKSNKCVIKPSHSLMYIHFNKFKFSYKFSYKLLFILCLILLLNIATDFIFYIQVRLYNYQLKSFFMSTNSIYLFRLIINRIILLHLSNADFDSKLVYVCITLYRILQ